MAWHIHFKNGQFAIWDTVVDAYITIWTTDEDYIIAEYATGDVYSRMKTAKAQIEEAKTHGCSAGKPVRHCKAEL